MSREVDERLAQSLAQWPQWPLGLKRTPEVVAELAGGRTNNAYLIEVDAQQYVLRLENKNIHALGIQRDFERRVHQVLGPLGICPLLHFSHRSLHYSLFEYIRGRTWTALDFNQQEQREKLHKVIARYQTHAITQAIAAPSFDYIAHLQHYHQQLSAAGMDDAQLKSDSYLFFIAQFDDYLKNNPQRLLTHHDLNPENIIETPGRLVILDWEYAGLGLAEFDLRSCNFNYHAEPFAHGQACEAGVMYELFFWLHFYWEKMQTLNL